MKLNSEIQNKIENFLRENNISENNIEKLLNIIEGRRPLRLRLLDSIIKSFSDKTRFFDTKSGWNQLWRLSDGALEELAKEIINIKQTITNKKTLKPQNGYISKNIKEDFSITRNRGLRIGVPENNLERLIALTNEFYAAKNYKIINQLPTPDDGHVDLYYRINNEINLIELKQWEGNDNPLYAIIELIKNYYLLFSQQNENVRKDFDIQKEKDDKVNLILLAPIDYYIKYAKKCREKSLVAFFELIKLLNLKLAKDNMCIKLLYLTIDRDTCEKNVKQKLEMGMKLEGNLCWRDFIDADIKKELNIEKIKKQFITNAKQWKSLEY